MTEEDLSYDLHQCESTCIHSTITSYALGALPAEGMPSLEDAFHEFEESFHNPKRMSAHASDAQMFLFAACLEQASPGLAKRLSFVRFPPGEGPYDQVETSAILRKAEGITPDMVLQSFATDELWGGVLTPRDALGLAAPLSHLWLDFLAPTNATEAAGLLALIMHLPHVDSKMIPRAIALADQIRPYLDTPEVRHVIENLPKVFARSPAAEDLTLEQRKAGAFALHDYFDEIGLLLYAILLDVPEIQPTIRDLDTSILLEMLCQAGELLPEAFLDIIEAHIDAPRKSDLALALIQLRAPHLSEPQQQVAASVLATQADTTIAQIVESLT